MKKCSQMWLIDQPYTKLGAGTLVWRKPCNILGKQKWWGNRDGIVMDDMFSKEKSRTLK